MRNEIQICPCVIHRSCSSSRAPEPEETFLRLVAVKFDSGSIEERILQSGKSSLVCSSAPSLSSKASQKEVPSQLPVPAMPDDEHCSNLFNAGYQNNMKRICLTELSTIITILRVQHYQDLLSQARVHDLSYRRL
jgi:predicted RNA-binding protein YlxR (DUF448 family)